MTDTMLNNALWMRSRDEKVQMKRSASSASLGDESPVSIDAMLDIMVPQGDEGWLVATVNDEAAPEVELMPEISLAPALLSKDEPEVEEQAEVQTGEYPTAAADDEESERLATWTSKKEAERKQLLDAWDAASANERRRLFPATAQHPNKKMSARAARILQEASKAMDKAILELSDDAPTSIMRRDLC